ncbi:MAG: aldose 1-epimerase [Pseudomonas sp.]
MPLRLDDELTSLTLAPELGGSIAKWTVKATGQALLRNSDQHALAAGTARRLACYPLAPWSNRIAHGGFDCPDGWFALAANSATDPLPIHGSAWQQPWQVIEHTPRQICLQLDSQLPFAYRAQQRFRLIDGRLNIELTVTHLAPRAAWHGLGLHPYFPRTPHTTLCAAAQQIWQCDESRLSTELSALPAGWDFEQACRLPSELVDNAFTGWNGHCRITQADAGYQLDCHASGVDYYILYCPVGQDFFCFEPVSHPTNAHHLPGRPGLHLLQQGQSIDMQFSMQYRALR